MLACAAVSARPAGLGALRRVAGPAARRAAPVRAFASPAEVLQLAADAAPGSVDAPAGAIVIGAIVVTALSFLVSGGLKGGTDAASEMQKRDARKFNKYDK